RDEPGAGVAPPQDGRGRDTSSLLVRVRGDGRGHEGLLDGARARPPGQVLRRTRLVVGAGGTCPAERLLTDDGAGGPVVDVEVARRETQYFLGPGHRRAVVGDDRTGQGVGRTPVDDLEDLLVLVVLVDAHGND